MIVQGGTFMSDATLRAFEAAHRRERRAPRYRPAAWVRTARPCSRATRAGATGTSTVLSADEIAGLTVAQRHVRCGRCSNNCQLTVNDFGEGRKFITGNRCEKGAGHKKRKTEAPNLFAAKNKLLFDRECLSPDEAPRGTVGIPRALNMYENYPFWHAFFTRLGFSVVLSDNSNKATYEGGIESMPSRACAIRPSSPTAMQ
ncbi:MAG: acyl-CoA dehydratase activase-related protein [Collinsella sp.]